ncbi:lipase acylhydrolase [Lacticaseibacillus thailandensis DSM 22698 = JCM 13996]|uniref:Lipase acylhydrolase n=3 Tax=Lacticaseibacillus thailandensis TaxID=381741 RepID=A0A0R2CHV1_9LACO|nr:lipase acylhydrolase [Lacticaseibacillus thailandensis DSM 22698 = JCM 13996]
MNNLILKRMIRALVVLAMAVVVGVGCTTLFVHNAQPLATGGGNSTTGAVNVVAVGDSLTHGVGDTTGQGGYVPLIAEDIRVETGATVHTSNYGVTGDTSLQILKRVRNNTKMQAQLKRANAITLTVGGNDLMHILQNNLNNINTADVNHGIQLFQRHVQTLIATIRKYNGNAPIYLFSIYNPFYVYFPNLTKMQTSVNNWNAATKKTAATLHRVHFVDINAVLSKGTAADQRSMKAGKSNLTNHLIYTKDHFHPNNAGYVKMTAKLWSAMSATEDEWE